MKNDNTGLPPKVGEQYQHYKQIGNVSIYELPIVFLVSIVIYFQ